MKRQYDYQARRGGFSMKRPKSYCLSSGRILFWPRYSPIGFFRR